MSGKVHKLRLDSISSKTTHPVMTSHRQCSFQICFFSFALKLSTFFSTSVRKTRTVWEQQLAYILEGLILCRIKTKPWILSATESHDCHQFAVVVVRGFRNRSLDQIPPNPA